MSRIDYQSRLNPLMTEIIRRAVGQRKTEFVESFKGAFLKNPTSTKIHVNFLRDETFTLLLFDGYIEIETSIACLRDAEVYIRRFPYTRAGIPKNRYLSYHYEAYLNELYLLHERVKRHLTELARRYKKGNRDTKIALVLASAQDDFRGRIAPLIQKRGHHVHQKRFDHPDIWRLKILETTDQGQPRIFNPKTVSKLFRLLATTIRHEIRANNDQVEAAADALFSTMLGCVFTATGEPNYPWLISPGA